MPTVIIINGFRLYFYSNENDEPIHVHIEKGNGSGKWWVESGFRRRICLWVYSKRA